MWLKGLSTGVLFALVRECAGDLRSHRHHWYAIGGRVTMPEEPGKKNDLTKDAVSAADVAKTSIDATSQSEQCICRKTVFKKWWGSVASFFSKLIKKKSC
jgi:hypothetical protein